MPSRRAALPASSNSDAAFANARNGAVMAAMIPSGTSSVRMASVSTRMPMVAIPADLPTPSNAAAKLPNRPGTSEKNPADSPTAAFSWSTVPADPLTDDRKPLSCFPALASPAVSPPVLAVIETLTRPKFLAAMAHPFARWRSCHISCCVCSRFGTGMKSHGCMAGLPFGRLALYC